VHSEFSCLLIIVILSVGKAGACHVNKMIMGTSGPYQIRSSPFFCFISLCVFGVS